MDRESFFVTDEKGHRHYAVDIERIFRDWSWMRRHWYIPAFVTVLLAVLGGCAEMFGTKNGSHNLEGLLFFFAVVGLFATGVFLFPGPGHELVKQWEREWGHLERDRAHVAKVAPSEDAIPAQQPHGHGYDEGTI